MIIIVFLLLSVFVVIQSVYGIGVLVFGVPTLLIYGLDYLSVVGVLLPSSVLISTTQILNQKNINIYETKLIPLAFLGIAAGVSISLLVVLTNFFFIILGFALLMLGVLRLNAKIRQKLAEILLRNKKLFHFLNAIFHGISNLGGPLLTLYSNSAFKDKQWAVYCTAVFYLIYALSQMFVLIVIGKGNVFWEGIIYLPIAALLHLLIGKKTLKIFSQHQFDNLTTVFFILTGIALSLRSFTF
jgi:uncharacterized protein